MTCQKGKAYMARRAFSPELGTGRWQIIHLRGCGYGRNDQAHEGHVFHAVHDASGLSPALVHIFPVRAVHKILGHRDLPARGGQGVGQIL